METSRSCDFHVFFLWQFTITLYRNIRVYFYIQITCVTSRLLEIVKIHGRRSSWKVCKKNRQSVPKALIGRRSCYEWRWSCPSVSLFVIKHTEKPTMLLVAGRKICSLRQLCCRSWLHPECDQITSVHFWVFLGVLLVSQRQLRLKTWS